MTEFTEIPVLDAAPLSRGAPEEMAAAFAKAYGETGFAYIVNHGVPEALVERVERGSSEMTVGCASWVGLAVQMEPKACLVEEEAHAFPELEKRCGSFSCMHTLVNLNHR